MVLHTTLHRHSLLSLKKLVLFVFSSFSSNISVGLKPGLNLCDCKKQDDTLKLPSHLRLNVIVWKIRLRQACPFSLLEIVCLVSVRMLHGKNTKKIGHMMATHPMWIQLLALFSRRCYQTIHTLFTKDLVQQAYLISCLSEPHIHVLTYSLIR